MNYILILTLFSDEHPKIISQYIINDNEKNEIVPYLQKDFFFQISEPEFTINCTNENLTYEIIENKELISAFKKLYKKHFFNYDLLQIIKEKISQNEFYSPKKEIENMFEMDDDINYYISTKKNTPEFSEINDEKIKKYIIETKKTIDLFKSYKE